MIAARYTQRTRLADMPTGQRVYSCKMMVRYDCAGCGTVCDRWEGSVEAYLQVCSWTCRKAEKSEVTQ